MSAVLEALARHAVRRPGDIAVAERAATHDFRTVHRLVQTFAQRLVDHGARVAGLVADNGLAWMVADLAAISAGVRLVPVPAFFSPAQQAHALRVSGADLLIAAHGADVDALPFGHRSSTRVAVGEGWLEIRLADVAPVATAQLPPGTRKITFTSGTTGQPKGVCLGLAEMERVAESLCSASHANAADVHLATLPLSLLLENIGGLYAPILAGATTVLRPMAEVGVVGAAGLDVAQLVAALSGSGATNAILVPQMLMALTSALAARGTRLPKLRFLAVGGAHVAPALLARATGCGLPVCEGYGLSECASVVTLNRPGAARPGTVGRPLPHARVEIASDGEVIVAGNGFRGYVGEMFRESSDPVATGDLGSFDDDGFLRLTGRKKHQFVTAYGRNVAPEWVEAELCAHPAIAQAAVFGEARPFNTAVITPRADEAIVEAAIRSVNAGLPDYARVGRWVVARAPFSIDNGHLTGNGRVRRSAIASDYHDQLHALYEDDSR
jgi:long-subunit acyl-CoA synthetase (AMP-forming)